VKRAVPPRIVIAASFSMTLTLLSGTSRATCDQTPRSAPSAIVRVESRSGSSLGVVVVSPDLVLVPFSVVSVERPWQVDAKVLDARGGKHDAMVIAADETAGLALLHVGVHLSDEPLRVRANPEGPQCPRSMETSLVTNTSTWMLVSYDGFPDPSAPFHVTNRRPQKWREGAPIIDDAGDLAAIVKKGGPSMRDDGPTRIDAQRIARFLDERATIGTRRPRVVLHYGTDLISELAPSAGVWGGIQFHAAMRIHDITELRMDASLTYLWPVNVREGGCVEGCVGGIRGAVTPSAGARITIANAGEPWNVTITPSFGLALGAQYVDANSSPAYDKTTPTTFVLAAPGVAASVGPVEAHGRVRLPGSGFDRETWEVGLGLEL